ASFDSTSPLRQAFKDSKDNYHTLNRAYVAVRVRQAEGNPKLQRLIASGQVSQDKARVLERACLEGLRRLDAGEKPVAEVLDDLQRYDALCKVDGNYLERYREVLTEQPWKACPCEVC